MRSVNNWPESSPDAVARYYGQPGSRQTRIQLPYPLRLSWQQQTRIHSMSCHVRVSDSLHRVLYNVHRLYGSDAIKQLGLDLFGGCLNVRKKRGGTTWSLHAYGAALDWDPVNNGLRTPWRKARFSQPEYIDFWNAWIYEGWEPLGLSWGRDAMHVQATANDLRPLRTNLYFTGGQHIA